MEEDLPLQAVMWASSIDVFCLLGTCFIDSNGSSKQFDSIHDFHRVTGFLQRLKRDNSLCRDTMSFARWTPTTSLTRSLSS